MNLKSNKSNNQSSIIDNQLEMPSTPVENVRQISFFMQNKPNFPHFSPENRDFAKKQTQNKPNSNPIKANFGPKIRVAKPNKPKFYPGVYPRVLLPRLAAGEWVLTCFGVYPRVCLPVFLPGVGDKPNFKCYFAKIGSYK
jgi:hypothetical protein